MKANRFVKFEDTHHDPDQNSAYYRARPVYTFHYETDRVKGLAVLDQKTGQVYVVFTSQDAGTSLYGEGIKMVAQTVAQHGGKL